ncbi:MAG: hypothetical protein RI922_2255 [Bacteroidota bacterium]|jgi:hypothetical protein
MKNYYKNWKSLALLCFLLISSFGNLQAQVSAYVFSQSAGTYTPVTGGTVLHTGTTDDAISASTGIGFNFTYNGVVYTSIKVNSNGWASFGTTTSTTTYTPLSTAGTHNPCLAPLGRDLQGNATGEVRIETSGVSPNQICTIQWKDYRRFAGTGQNFNFQIKLYETSNKVQFVYGTMTASALNSDYDCGITGAANTDFNVRTTTTDWANSTAGATNAANMTLSTTVFPAVGQTYTWVAPPATPPTPTQAAGIPTCSAGTAIDLAGPAPTDVTWYWQTSATGTSTSNPYTGPYTVFANGTYYARAYNAVTGVWSLASSSIVISNFPVATPPPAAVAATDPSCVPLGSTLIAATPTAGYLYFWQGSVSGGSSTALPSTTPYPYTTSGTYYLAAQEITSGCWSNTVGTTVTVNSVIPANPVLTLPAYNYCSGVTSAPVIATVPTLIVSGTCSATATASGTDNTGVTATVNNFSCATGNIIGATLNASIGANCPSWYYYSIVVNGVTVATQQCNQTGYDLTPYLPLSSVQVISADNPLDGFGDFVTMNLTVNLTYSGPASPQPAYTLSWFDATTAGNLLGTGSPLEGLGTSVMPAATNGSYNFYVQTELAGCSSLGRELVVVNITDVNASLTPINVTCNGGNNGSFALGTVQCGTAPFTYSVDGGAYGPIPTDLVAGTYSVVMQDVNGLFSAPIQVVLTQPAAPANVAMGQINYFSADISWTTTGNETQWNVEFGPVGFTPGTGAGTIQVANTNFFTITGLTEDTQYDVYVSAVCGPNPEFSNTVTFSTNPGFLAWDNMCPTAGFVDISGTGTDLGLTDDSESGITLPFSFTYDGTSMNTLTVGNNGGVLLNTLTGNVGYGGNMTTLAPNYLFLWGDDLDGQTGNVYWEVTGTSPNQIAIVQWDNINNFYNGPGTVTFQLQINEATNEIYYVYQDVVFGGTETADDYAGNADIGVSSSTTDINVSNNNQTYLQNNSCVHFYNALCPNPTNMASLVFQEEIDLTWTAGPYNETLWTVIYGPVGFDPATSGTILTTTTPSIQITGLTQLTEYDIYVYSECAADNLTSGGFLVNATTLPWCADPITVSGTDAVDSIFMTWDWIPVATATNGGISSFNMTYGQTNFDLYSNGTELVANGVDFADSIIDATFLPGQVIDVYVQAVCGVDTSNYVGPFTIVMPISNDTVCGAEELMVDGTVYIFDNTGATVTTGETGIVPSQTGYNTTDLPQQGWGQPTLQRTTWFTFTAPASGSMRFSGEDINTFWSQIAIYDAPICNDFNTFDLIAASDQATVDITTVGNTTTIDTVKVAPNFTICGLTPGATYYIMHDSWAGANGATTLQGQYSISMTPINLEAGTFVNVLDACTGTSVVLFDGITGYQPAGAWTAELAPAGTGLTDSLFNTSGLGYQVFNFEYRVTDGCAYDSIVSQVQIYPLSSAGTDGTITVCRNEPVDLLQGLGGNVDLGGDWYNPSNQLMPSSAINASNIPGLFNYDYITGNGVCPDDTANVLLTVDGSCNYLDVQEMTFASMSLFPNPTNGLVYITNEGTSDVFNYEVIDIDGRVIASKANAINGSSTTTIDLTGKVTGMYMIRVYNGNAEKVFRVVLQ